MFGLSSLTSLAIIVAIAGIVGFTGGVTVTAKIEHGVQAEMKAGYATAQAKAAIAAAAQQAKDVEIAKQAGQKEVAAQAALTDQAKRALAEVQAHVHKVPSNCITWGFVRVLDARVHGVEASALALPAGRTDASCTGLDAAVLAQAIVDNYSLYAAVRERNNSLIDVTVNLQNARKTP